MNRWNPLQASAFRSTAWAAALLCMCACLRWCTHPNPCMQGIDVTGLPPPPAVPKPAVAPAATAPVAAKAAAEPAPVPYAQRKASPQPAPLGSLAKMPAASAKPAAPAAAAPAAAPARASSPAAAKWDHATRVMPAGSAAPVTPKMDAAAYKQAASKPAAPSPAPASVNRWADFSLGHPNSSKRVRTLLTALLGTPVQTVSGGCCVSTSMMLAWPRAAAAPCMPADALCCCPNPPHMCRALM